MKTYKRYYKYRGNPNIKYCINHFYTSLIGMGSKYISRSIPKPKRSVKFSNSSKLKKPNSLSCKSTLPKNTLVIGLNSVANQVPIPTGLKNLAMTIGFSIS